MSISGFEIMLSFAKKTFSATANDCSETLCERYFDTGKYRKTLNLDAFYAVKRLDLP